MLIAALQQGGKVEHTALSVQTLTFASLPALLASDREDGIFHQQQHRYISSPSQSDPPPVS